MTDVTARDLVNHSLAEKPLDFEAAMFEVMRQKANYAISLKKAEFAKSIFGDPKVEDEPEEDEVEDEAETDDEDQESEETEEEEVEDGQDS
jgi:hypothetical protein